MRVISAYLLAVLGGNSSPSKDDITKILGSVGIEADEDRVDALLKELDGKDITEVIAAGVSKLASVPSGGGAMVASGGGGGGGGGGAAAEEEKKEEKKEEEEEEEDEDMGFSLFD
ncbi:probable 60S acidic ribosomal protein P2 at N-terminal half [Coccomyxa sp. Obi]|nr:probable 60S acidic ribosomal protein P2 at N-terminal half [Coccomyxa sp. Obi]